MNGGGFDGRVRERSSFMCVTVCFVYKKNEETGPSKRATIRPTQWAKKGRENGVQNGGVLHAKYIYRIINK